MNENSRFSFLSRAPEETASSAHNLAGVLAPWMVADGAFVISLIGDLGAGKTCFVKGLAEGLGLDPNAVSSPTFAIINEYDSAEGPPLVHLDFYRLESEMALEEVGFLDLLALPAILAIEWGNRFPKSLPLDHMRVEIDWEWVSAEPATEVAAAKNGPRDSHERQETEEKSPRTFNVTATGLRSRQALAAWRAALG